MIDKGKMIIKKPGFFPGFFMPINFLMFEESSSANPLLSQADLR